jgi:hypothetical protein
MHVIYGRFRMTLNYRVIVERHLFINGVVGGPIATIKPFLYLTKNN